MNGGGRPLTVLLVSSFLHPRGGDTTCLGLLADGLRARGHAVVPFGVRHPENPADPRFPAWTDPRDVRGLGRLRALGEAIWSRTAAAAMAALLREVRPDVAHVHHVHRHLTPSVLGPLRAAGVPVVWTVHDYELVCPAGTLSAGTRAGAPAPGAPCSRCAGHRYHHAVRGRCRRDDLAQSAVVALEKWVHARRGVQDRVDRFLCPSRFLADQLVAFGVPAARVLHLPNAVAPAPAGGAPGAHWVFAGRLVREKGVDELLAAARLLPSRRLRVCGGGPELPRLRREAPPNVTLLGPLSVEGVAAELRAAGAVAVPSRWPENQPYAVLEAQMAGRAVVAARVGGVPELIDDGVDGLLVPPGAPRALADAVEALLADPARGARLGNAARARVLADNAPDPWLDRVEAVYRDP